MSELVIIESPIFLDIKYLNWIYYKRIKTILTTLETISTGKELINSFLRYYYREKHRDTIFRCMEDTDRIKQARNGDLSAINYFVEYIQNTPEIAKLLDSSHGIICNDMEGLNYIPIQLVRGFNQFGSSKTQKKLIITSTQQYKRFKETFTEEINQADVFHIKRSPTLPAKDFDKFPTLSATKPSASSFARSVQFKPSRFNLKFKQVHSDTPLEFIVLLEVAESEKLTVVNGWELIFKANKLDLNHNEIRLQPIILSTKVDFSLTFHHVFKNHLDDAQDPFLNATPSYISHPAIFGKFPIILTKSYIEAIMGNMLVDFVVHIRELNTVSNIRYTLFYEPVFSKQQIVTTRRFPEGCCRHFTGDVFKADFGLFEFRDEKLVRLIIFEVWGVSKEDLSNNQNENSKLLKQYIKRKNEKLLFYKELQLSENIHLIQTDVTMLKNEFGQYDDTLVENEKQRVLKLLQEIVAKIPTTSLDNKVHYEQNIFII